jgi:hypothetical protein
MTDAPVKPERITKPIQLLGAWLAGLLSIDTCFLVAAAQMPAESWEMRALVLASIVNVPLFLAAVFLLQTRFRPEMQEDSYYSSYLSRKTNERIVVSKDDIQLFQITKKVSDLESRLLAADRKRMPLHAGLQDLSVGVNQSLEDREVISQRLSEAGILGFTTFGDDEPLEDRTVAISQFLPPEKITQILSLSRELGFKRYTVYDNLAEEIVEDVLFGSYGAADREIAGSA